MSLHNILMIKCNKNTLPHLSDITLMVQWRKIIIKQKNNIGIVQNCSWIFGWSSNLFYLNFVVYIVEFFDEVFILIA